MLSLTWLLADESYTDFRIVIYTGRLLTFIDAQLSTTR